MTDGGSVSQVEALLTAATRFERAGDPDAAERALRDAVAIGDPEDDPRVALARFLARRGDRDGCDVLLAELWRERPRSPWTYIGAAQVLVDRGDLAAALKWANTGAFRHIKLDEDLDSDAYVLLEMRRQVRFAIGFPDDEYDLLVGESSLPELDEDDDGWDVPSNP